MDSTPPTPNQFELRNEDEQNPWRNSSQAQVVNKKQKYSDGDTIGASRNTVHVRQIVLTTEHRLVDWGGCRANSTIPFTISSWPSWPLNANTWFVSNVVHFHCNRNRCWYYWCLVGRVGKMVCSCVIPLFHSDLMFQLGWVTYAKDGVHMGSFIMKSPVAVVLTVSSDVTILVNTTLTPWISRGGVYWMVHLERLVSHRLKLWEVIPSSYNLHCLSCKILCFLSSRLTHTLLDRLLS